MSEPAAPLDNTRTHWPIVAARAADDKLGQNTVILDVGDVLAITDYFVITNGANARQVRAIVNAVSMEVKRQGGPMPRRVEGEAGSSWVLVDFGDFVVHVFGADERAHFNLDSLWSDRPKVEWVDDADSSRGDHGAELH